VVVVVQVGIDAFFNSCGLLESAFTVLVEERLKKDVLIGEAGH